MIRRAVDVTVAASALVVLSPVLGALAVVVVIDSPGPPFYGGPRVGQDGRVFRMWKLRTMTAGADRGPGISVSGDPRVTRVGRYLRATKLDELPQLVNLLAGDLTLVGPRPEVPSIVARYTDEQRLVLAVKPGITGPGQLHFTTDQQASIPAGVDPDDYYVEHLLGPKLEIDLDYCRRRTARSDLRVVAATVRAMVRGALEPAA